MAGPDQMKSAYPVVSVVSDSLDERKRSVLGSNLRQKSWLSRNKWLVAGLSVIAVAVIVISVSLTAVNRSSSKSHNAVRSPTSAPTQVADTTVHELPPPDQYNAADWEGLTVDFYKQLNDSAKLTPENIKKFMAEARVFLKTKFNVTLAEDVGSPKTILHYLQVSKQFQIIDAILQWVDGKNLTMLNFDDVLNLVNQLQSAFNLDRIFEFNKAMSVAHEYVASKMQVETSSMSMEDLLNNFTAAGYDMSEQEALTGVQSMKNKKSKYSPKKSPSWTKKSPPKSPGKSPSWKSPPGKSAPGKSPPGKSAPGKSPPGKSPPGKASSAGSLPTPKFNFGSLNLKVVFHVLQYKDTTKSGKVVVQPPIAKDAQAAASNIVAKVNEILAKYKTGMTLEIAEVRANVEKYPYLLLSNLKEWQSLAAEGIQSKGISWLETQNAPVDKYLNVWVAGSFNIPQEPCQTPDGIDCGRGYAWVPPIVSCEETEKQKWQHLFIMFDEFSLAWYNKDWGGYTPGATVFSHELGHHLGLQHTHAGPNKYPYGCSSPNDEIQDTAENDDAQLQKWWDKADGLCGDTLDGGKVNWDIASKEFDSCPRDPGPDAIHNIMSYSPDSCRNIRNLALTSQQVLYMQMKIQQCRPKLYACASGKDKTCYN